MAVPQRCPKCGADLQGEAIPEKDRELFAPETHFSRVIGIYDLLDDMTVAWQCPDCNHEWPRTEECGGLRTFPMVSR